MSEAFSNVLGVFTRNRSALASACLAALAFGAGCSAEAEIPEVTVTRSDVEFEGVAIPDIPGVEIPDHVSAEFDHPSDFELPEDFNPELHPLSAQITARGDMRSLSFLEKLHVTLASRAPNAPPPLVLASYDRPTSGTVGREIELKLAPDADVLSYWDTDQAYYDVTIWGTLPEQDWSIDVTFSFSGKLSTD